MRIVVTGLRKGRGYEWHVETVPFWVWRLRRGESAMGYAERWNETWWRIGRLHIKRFVRVLETP